MPERMNVMRRGVAAAVLAAGVLCAAEERTAEENAEQVMEWHIGLTQIYQQNVRGGLSTSEREGRYAGSYDLESTFDLDSLAGIHETELYVLIEGGWPQAGSIDPESVGSFFGVNGDAIEGQWSQLSELWVERSFAKGGVLVRAGKLDLTGGFEHRGDDVSFDGSWYANDETSQFLNGALVNNPTIPFPGWTLGAAAFVGVSESLHVGLAVATRDADGAGDEFATWGSTSDGFFYVVEGGYRVYSSKEPSRQTGDYHVGLWGEASDEDSGSRRGVYVSASQHLVSNGDNLCDGGLGMFVRAGWADGDDVEMGTFWSFGLQYQGLAATDGTDVLGLGLAHGAFSGSAAAEGLLGSETALELYYSAPVFERMTVSPSIQYISNPGGDAGRDALIVGVRAQILLH